MVKPLLHMVEDDGMRQVHMVPYMVEDPMMVKVLHLLSKDLVLLLPVVVNTNRSVLTKSPMPILERSDNSRKKWRDHVLAHDPAWAFTHNDTKQYKMHASSKGGQQSSNEADLCGT